MNSTPKHACLRCRTSKLRCFLDTLPEHSKCRRCHDAGAECVFKSTPPRARRKRTDTRVSELERQIAGLKAAFQDRNSYSHPPGGEPDHVLQQETSADVSATIEKRRSEPSRELEYDIVPSASRLGGTNGGKRYQIEIIPGVVPADLVSPAQAHSLFTQFVTKVLPEYPVLALKDSDDFHSLRISHPTLLVAMITAASRASNPCLFRRLHSHLLSLLADLILVQGHRSLELAQAIVVMEEWYDPPDDMRRLNFYMWIQIAGTMIRQLGLWPWTEASPSTIMNSHELGEPDDHLMGEWRTAFAVYLSMSTVAISLRRPMMMTWTESMRADLALFGQSSTNLNDKRLAAWVRLQMIAEDVEAVRVKSIAIERGTGNPSPIDPVIIQALESKIAEWRDTNQMVMNASLRVHFFYCRTKLYEVAATIYRVPPASLSISTNTPQSTPQSQKYDSAGDVIYIRTVMSLVQASHSILDTLLQLDITTYLMCPTCITVRALYAIQEIYTLWKLATCQRTYMSNFISDEVLAVKFYTKQTKTYLERAAGQEGFQVPKMALTSLANITNHVLPLSSKHEAPQPPRLVPTLRPSEAAKSSTEAHSNDLEAILVTDVIHHVRQKPISYSARLHPAYLRPSLHERTAIPTTIRRTTHLGRYGRSWLYYFRVRNDGYAGCHNRAELVVFGMIHLHYPGIGNSWPDFRSREWPILF